MLPIQKVIAIGDSFLAGSELKNSNATWPALFAANHELAYQCLARPGHSIQYVLRTLYECLYRETDRCFFVLHWPSALRFEYANRKNDSWIQINPNAILFGDTESEQVQKIYYQYANSLLGDKWQALSMIFSAVLALKQTDHVYAMTTVDDFLFRTDFHNPSYIEFLQQQCQPSVRDFDGLPFHQWADKHGFAKGVREHPLDQAHKAAFEYMKPLYQQLLGISNSESLP